MTKRLFGIVLTLLAIVLSACKDDVTTAGGSILDDEDVILVKADTFALRSGIIECDHIISSPDSFLLGEIETDYGVLQADILTQLACPVGYRYPDNAEIDSVCLFLYYRSWEGSSTSPLAVTAYQIDGTMLEYAPKEPYRTDIAIEDYCSMVDSTLLLDNRRIIVAEEKLDSIYSSEAETYLPMVRCRLSDDFAQRFFKMRHYTSQEEFNRFFKGLYITSTFGSSTILNLTDINMAVYYHFSYRKTGSDKDTIVNDMKGFYANSEVRQLNRFEYQNKKELVEKLRKDSSEHNYIIAPAGVYTRMSLPMQKMADVIQGNLIHNGMEKRPYVNMAELRVDVLNIFAGSTTEQTRNDWLQPSPYMLLIKESSQEEFFKSKQLPTDTMAILSALQSGVDKEGDPTYYYSYDLSTLLTDQLRKKENQDTLHMLLVPVSVETAMGNNQTSIVSLKQAQTLSATQIHSASNTENPMTLKVVYSGFGHTEQE